MMVVYVMDIMKNVFINNIISQQQKINIIIILKVPNFQVFIKYKYTLNHILFLFVYIFKMITCMIFFTEIVKARTFNKLIDCILKQKKVIKKLCIMY